MEKVRLGIIGIGNMGSVHAKKIFAGDIKGLELSAVCDISKDKEKWAAEKFRDVPFFYDYKDLVRSGKVDAVLIATPHYIHPEAAIYSFEAGLNVLVEKPAGVYTGQVRKMNEAAEKSGKIFAIMYNQRTNPIYKKLRDMIKSGELGELKRCVWIITNWYRTQAYYDSGTWRATWAGEGGGVLINQCPHNLDLWQWIFGMPEKIKGFCAYGKYHNIEVEDDVTAYAEYANGATGVFIATTGECPGTNRLEISGDRGKVVVEDGNMNFSELAESEREYCFKSDDGFGNIEHKIRAIVPDGTESGHNGILQNFTNAILYGEELIAPGCEGINGLMISNAIHLSDWTDEIVTLPVNEEKYLGMLNDKISNSTVKKAVSESKIADLSKTYNTL